MLLPRVKTESRGDGFALLDTSVVLGEGVSLDLLEACAALMPGISFSVSDHGEGAFSFSLVTDGSIPREGYTLKCERGRVCARASDYAGLVHAAATVAGLLLFCDGVYYLFDAEITDAPDTSFRSLMLDPARNLIPMDEVRATVIAMARAKLNKLHLHLSDDRGFAYVSGRCPELPLSPKGAYTVEELSKIIRLCAVFGIDVIPEIDVPAHSHALTGKDPSLKCKSADGRDFSGWNLCLGNEAAYALIERAIGELAEIFPYEYIHVGTDEMDMRDLDMTPPPISHSTECTVCNAFFAPMGLNTLRERFYYFVRRVYAMVNACGKKMMMWNDDVDISADPDIPHDILIEFWRVAAEGRGPVEGCSMQGFLDAGFDVVNADFENTYLDEYVKHEKLCAWNPLRDPAADSAGHIQGGDVCLWEGSNYPHYLYATYFALPLFGDRLWNCHTPIAWDEQASLALTRACLGANVLDFDLFSYLDGVPLGDAFFKEGKIFGADADLERLKELLSSLSVMGEDAQHLKRALLDLMD